MRRRLISQGAQERIACYTLIFSTAFAFLALLIYPTLIPGKTYADEVIEVNPSISISPASPVTLNVDPATFNSVNETITVATSNYTGYTLNLSTTGASTDLVHTEDSTLTVPTITLPSGSSSITSSSFTNGYGYSMDATNYKPAPAKSGTGDDIAVTSHENPGTGSHTLTFGARVNDGTPSGNYQNQFTLTATANDATYSIAYYDNAGGDTVTNMPSANESTVSGTTVTISDKTPIRNGYEFLGWAESSSASSATIQPSGTFTLSPTGANAKTYYAVWEYSRYMQNVSLWADRLEVGDSTTAVDVRDATVYTVARLSDGKLWMTRNLRLQMANLEQNISTSNTNNPSASFMTWANTYPVANNGTWCYSSNAECVEQYMYDNSNVNVNTQDAQGVAYDEYGVYYNGYTISAGQINSYNAKGDICPYGWHLPGYEYLEGTGVTQNEFTGLNNAVNSGSISTLTGLTSDPVNIVYSGFKRETVLNRGTQFLYTTGYRNTPSFGNHYMAYYGTSLNISSGSAKTSDSYGMTVRCVAGQQFTLNYHGNGGIFSVGSKTIYDESASSKTLAIHSGTPTRTGYTFLGWDTNPNASTATYQPGDLVTLTLGTNNITDLYAIWQASNNLTMQNVASWADNYSLVGDTTTAIDTRDNQGYSVARLADGKLWMTKNLRLDFSNLTTSISASNTNNPTNAFITAANNGITSDNTSTWCTALTSECLNTYKYDTRHIGDSGTNNYNTVLDDYGIYYNYYLASAGHGNASYTGNVQGDICPYGWRLPDGTAATGDYAVLNTEANSGSTTSGTVYTSSPINMVFAGYRSTTGIAGAGSVNPSYVYLWTNRIYASGGNNYGKYFLYRYNSTDSTNILVNTEAGAQGFYGLPIRCVAGQNYRLYYDANGGHGAPSAREEYDEATTYIFTISSTTPSRTGYDFLGWSTDPTAVSASYQPNGSISLSFTNHDVTLYAIWQQSESGQTMQNVSQWASDYALIGDTTTAIDTRDNEGYTVARLADGKLWMTKNLRLDLTKLVNNISASNTNNPTSAFMTLANASPSAITTFCTSNSSSCWDSVQYYTSNIDDLTVDSNGDTYDDYGVFYNYFTASAGNGASDMQASGAAENVPGDLCPYGWRLPTGLDGGDFNLMNTEENSGSTSDPAGLLADPANFVMAGYVWGASPTLKGTSIFLWTASAFKSSSNNYPYGVYAGYSNLTHLITWANGLQRQHGMPIRCVAGQQYTLRYNANGGIGAPANQSNYEENVSKTFTISSTSPTRTGYTFLGWSTDPTAISASYQPNGSITLSFSGHDTTLYAVWQVNNNLTMQNVAQWANSYTTVGATTTAIDTRDNKGYTVARMADGKLWMTKNLQLDPSNLATTITASNTNNPTNAFMTWANASPAATTTGWCTTYTSASCTDTFTYNNYQTGNAGMDAQGSIYDEYGVYYNYYTATAGHGDSSHSSYDNMSGDICPYGWRLATGGSASEFATFNTQVNSGSTTDGYTNLGPGTLFNLPFAGYWNGSTAYFNGDDTTAPQAQISAGTTYSYSTYLSGFFYGFNKNLNDLSSSWVRTSYTTLRTYGLPIRCVAGQQYTITYHANDGINTPAAQTQYSDTTTSYTFTLTSSRPTRTGYTFLGWSTNASASSASYNPGDSLTLTFNNNTIDLYAVWAETESDQTMQNVAQWADNYNLVGDTTTAIDTRDGQGYTVARLADGRLWMTKNLRLDFSDINTSISASNTNNPTASFVTAANALPSPITGTWCTTHDSTCEDKIAYNPKWIGEESLDSHGIAKDNYGVYYNWYTATAGQGSTTATIDTSESTTGDLCPYGWHLPTGAAPDLDGYEGEYYDLNVAVNSGSTTDPSGLYVSPVNMIRSGYINGANNYNWGSYGFRHWTSTKGTESAGNAQYFEGYEDPDNSSYNKVRTDQSTNFYMGYTIRCVAGQRYEIIYEDNHGSGSPSPDVYYSDTARSHTFAVTSTTPTRTAYTFLGWSTDKNATTATYVANDNITATFNNNVIKLYAVWSKPNNRTLQSVASWNTTITTGTGTTTAIDSRDGKSYTVARLSDGRLWMTKNLQLDFSDLSTTITASNTNNPGSAFMTWANTNPEPDHNANIWCTTNTSECTDRFAYSIAENEEGIDEQGSNYDDYGLYYNIYTATTGSISSSSADGAVATGDICPYGWRLPTAGSGSEYYYLNYYVNNGSTTNGGANLRVGTTFNLPYAGYKYGSIISGDAEGNNRLPRAYILTSNVWLQSSSSTLYSYYFGFQNDLDGTDSSWVRYTYGLGRSSGAPIRCVADERKFTLYFSAEGGSGAPSAQTTADIFTSSNTFTVPVGTPTRSGWTFNGWYFEDAPNTLYQAGDSVTISTSNSTKTVNGGVRYYRTLLASWTPQYTMQTVSTWGPSLAQGTTVYAVDTRDEQTYTVARLTDGRLWMTRNLRLVFSELKNNITASNTHNPSSAFMTWANAKPTGTWAATDWCTTNTDSTCADKYIYASRVGQSGTSSAGEPYDEFGVYYNAYTAVAGTVDSSITSETFASGDVCPYGWKLPQGSVYGEWYYLNYYLQGGTASTDPTALFSSSTNANFIRSGYKSAGSNYASNVMRFWSNNFYISSGAIYNTYFGSYEDESDSTASWIRWNYGQNRTWGLAIRCIADENTYQLRYSANGGSGAPSTQSVTKSFADSYTFTIPNTTPTRSGWTFNGWTLSGSSTLYHAGDTITVYKTDTSGYNGSAFHYKQLTASWTASYTMQTVGTWGPSVTVGSSVEAVDTRDNKAYTVKRLEDGRLWMTQNLGLSLASLQQDISASNTNNPTSSFMTAANAKPASLAPASWCTSNDATCNNQIEYYAYGNYNNVGYLGTFFNFYTVAAGNWTYGTAALNGTAGDICPYGWRLPSGGKAWSEYKLYNDLVNNGSTSDATNLMSANMNLILSGYITFPTSGSPRLTNVTYTNDLWTGSNSGTIGYNLYVYPTSSSTKVNPGSTTYAKSGYPTRCIAKEYATVNITYGASGNLDGIDVDGVDVAHGSSISLEVGVPHTITLGNVTTAAFDGWQIQTNNSGPGAGTTFLAYDTNSTTMTIVINKAATLSIWPNMDETATFDYQFADEGKSKVNGYYTMQDLYDIRRDYIADGATTTLIDTRDNQTYTVKNVVINEDGDDQSYVWMTQNLNLGATAVSDPAFSNGTAASVTASTFNSWRTTNQSATYTAGQVFYTGNASTDAYGNKFGSLYNYYALSGGTISGGGSVDELSWDNLCPPNWEVPSADLMQATIDKYGLTYLTLQTGPLGFPKAGRVYSGSSRQDTGTGNYWLSSLTGDFANKRDYLIIDSSSYRIEPGDRVLSMSVRCVCWGNG